MRLDQFLLTDTAFYVPTTGEEFRLGDPARDVGAYVGEWLPHRAVLRDSAQETDDVLGPS